MLCAGTAWPQPGCAAAEPELDRVAVAIDGAVEIFPLASDLDVSFVDMPFARYRAFALIEVLQQERGIVNCPPVDGGMVN